MTVPKPVILINHYHQCLAKPSNRSLKFLIINYLQGFFLRDDFKCFSLDSNLYRNEMIHSGKTIIFI